MKPSLLQVINRMEELGDEDYRVSESFEDYSKFYECEGNLRWIWRKGVNLGKKMVVTGVVISSAPFVLPPLVVITAIGFAFSLPAGLVFATYACTNKLMSTLLPMPSRPLRLESGEMSSEEEERRVYGDEIDEGYEEDDDEVIDEEKEFKEDTRKEIEERVELADEDCGVPIYRDERDSRTRGTEIVEEVLDSSAIPEIMEGIREAEDEISKMEREGVEMPKDSLRAMIVEAGVGGRNENDVEQVTGELVFVPPRDKNRNNGERADVDGKELRNETTPLLEEIRDEGKNDRRKKRKPKKGKRQENERDVGISIKSVPEERRDEKLSVIPEEVKPSGSVGSEDLGESRNKIRVEQEQPEVVIERTVVVNVKMSGDRTTTDVHEGTSSDDKIETTLIVSEVAALEMADESGFDQFTDSLNRGGDFVSESSADVSVDYHEVRIDESIPPVSRHADKELVNEEKIWQQMHAIRTIIGYKTAPHESCVDELEALYVFTGVEPPMSSKDDPGLADVNEKLHFLMSIIGVK
ncbi:hypothetical protein RND81_09G245800 [Saponaria officinalis]|uniref:Uncharacterized protein n=1 Tax=Saponaria officinalis TaxID=3572 RepID=A0AAW1IQ35_SAPOF